MGFSHSLFTQLPNRGKQTEVSLRFNQSAGKSLTESQLSADQTVEMHEDDTMTITATINLTSQLVWWLRGFGKGLIDAKPELLFTAVKQDALV
jgi:hypothetical protein